MNSLFNTSTRHSTMHISGDEDRYIPFWKADKIVHTFRDIKEGALKTQVSNN